MLLVVNICPAITESTAPYSHLCLSSSSSSLFLVLCGASPKDYEMLSVQDPSHA